MLPALAVTMSCLSAQGGAAPQSEPLRPEELAGIDAALARGRSWLLANQSADGAFAPVASPGVCRVALSSMALWALASSSSEPADSLLDAARFLLAHQQPDGGIHDPRRGLAVYTSGVALQALRSLSSAQVLPEVGDALAHLDLFVYRARAPESLADVEKDLRKGSDGHEQARSLLRDPARFSSAEKKALAFLAGSAPDASAPPLRLRVPGWQGAGAELGPFSYEDVLPFVYLPLEADHQVALRAHQALQSYYDLERNPDLTKRYGELGFQPGTQGLYYYYLLVARALAVRGVPWIELASGEKRDWVRELSGRLLSLQRRDGSWKNADAHWWEDEPILVTSYATLALQLCRNVGSR